MTATTSATNTSYIRWRKKHHAGQVFGSWHQIARPGHTVCGLRPPLVGVVETHPTEPGGSNHCQNCRRQGRAFAGNRL